MGLQRVGHDWVTELNWTELSVSLIHIGAIKQILHKDFEQQRVTWWQISSFQGKDGGISVKLEILCLQQQKKGSLEKVSLFPLPNLVSDL